METAQKVAKFLLDIRAIKLHISNPFTWASGWKSPIYCDNRLSLSYPEARTFIKNAIVNKIKTNFVNVEAIAGVATAGIPQGALVADALGIPFVYVRSKAKGHGMENLIEGKITPGQKVVVIEDLVSTGGSSLKAVDALLHHKFEVLGMVSIFTYGFPLANKNFNDKGIQLEPLCSYQELIAEALKLNYITEKDVQSLERWRENPESWGSD